MFARHPFPLFPVGNTSEGDGITNSMPVPDLFSLHEEADTRIILHCLYAAKQVNTTRVIVRSHDTDVFLLLLSFSDVIGKTLILDTGTGNRRRQINISQLASSFSKQLRDALLGLHAFTGCDTTSCFAGKGKVKPLKIIRNDDHLTEVFSRLGTDENISVEDQHSLEHFVCRLYGKKNSNKC